MKSNLKLKRSWNQRILFEEKLAAYVGAKYAVGVSSGTSAIEFALRAAGIKPGDEVVVPANTFFATAEAVSIVGAKPVFADVDEKTFHLNIESVERAITDKTRAIIPVHLYGRAMDLTQVEQLAARRNLIIIEDAAQALGAGMNGVKVGGNGRLTCYSFYPGKNLGAYGDAGAVTTNDRNQAELIKILREHGSPSKYQHSMIGSNGRLDAIQAAVLSVKLPHLDDWNILRRQHARSFWNALQGSDIIAPDLARDKEHIFHLFVIRSARRDELKKWLGDRGIGAGIHYPVPLHLTGAYQALGYPGTGSYPVAEQLANEILSVPLFPELSQAQIARCTESLLSFGHSK